MAVLVVGLRESVRPAATWHRIAADAATMTVLVGVAAGFLWVILGDLFEWFDRGLSDPTYAVVPLFPLPPSAMVTATRRPGSAWTHPAASSGEAGALFDRLDGSRPSAE